MARGLAHGLCWPWPGSRIFEAKAASSQAKAMAREPSQAMPITTYLRFLIPNLRHFVVCICLLYVYIAVTLRGE